MIRFKNKVLFHIKTGNMHIFCFYIYISDEE